MGLSDGTIPGDYQWYYNPDMLGLGVHVEGSLIHADSRLPQTGWRHDFFRRPL